MATKRTTKTRNKNVPARGSSTSDKPEMARVDAELLKFRIAAVHEEWNKPPAKVKSNNAWLRDELRRAIAKPSPVARWLALAPWANRFSTGGGTLLALDDRGTLARAFFPQHPTTAPEDDSAINITLLWAGAFYTTTQELLPLTHAAKLDRAPLHKLVLVIRDVLEEKTVEIATMGLREAETVVAMLGETGDGAPKGRSRAAKVVARLDWMRQQIAMDPKWPLQQPKQLVKLCKDAGHVVGRDQIKRDLHDIRDDTK